MREKQNQTCGLKKCIYIYIYGTVATISTIQWSNRAANNILKVGIFDSAKKKRLESLIAGEEGGGDW